MTARPTSGIGRAMTRLLHAYGPDGSIDADALNVASGILRAGGLVALPTETVYGLGAHALQAAAVARIYAAKGRPGFNPLIVHVTGEDAARTLAAQWPESAHLLARAFWPGPITLVVPRASCIPDVVTGGGPTVALRAPAHPVARALLELSRLPVAAPSANPSGAVSPTTAAHVLTGLDGRIDAVLDGGPCTVGIESTVVDCTSWPVQVLRPGSISTEKIAAVLGAAGQQDLTVDTGVRAAPGLLSRHYALGATTFLFKAADLGKRLHELPSDARVGLLLLTAAAPRDQRVVAVERLANEPDEAARTVYAALHRLEAAGCTHALLERLPDDTRWDALRDRLTRAAGSPDA